MPNMGRRIEDLVGGAVWSKPHTTAEGTVTRR